MSPFWFHDPPHAFSTDASVVVGPPAASIHFNLLSAKKPMAWLSGLQKGKVAPSVPDSGCALNAESGRIQSCTLPATVAEKTNRRPSGEIANEFVLLVGG